MQLSCLFTKCSIFVHVSSLIKWALLFGLIPNFQCFFFPMLIVFVGKEHVRFLILMSFLLGLNIFVMCITQNEKDLICIEFLKIF
jgi:hypothetical protein